MFYAEENAQTGSFSEVAKTLNSIKEANQNLKIIDEDEKE